MDKTCERQLEEYKYLCDSLPDALAILDKKGRLLMVSKALLDLTGHKKKELIGKSVLDLQLISKEELPAVAKKIKQVLAGKKEFFHDITITTKNGKKLIGEINDKKIKYQGKDAVLIIARDVTQQREIERELLFKSILLETQKESSIDGILIVDDKGKILSFNEQFKKIWGIPEKVLKTRLDEKMLAFVTPQLENPDQFIKGVQYLYKHKKKKSRDKILLKDGRVFDRYSAPLIDPKGNYLGRIWFFRDITKRVRLDKLKTEFVSIASHQLRTPLTAIRWVTERILRNNDLPAKTREYLNDIHFSCQRLSDLVTNLLNVSRFEEGEITIYPERIELVSFIENYLKEAALSAKGKEITLLFKKHPSKLIVSLDRNILRNIIQSLVSNAIEYTPHKGKVEISLEKRDSRIFLTVSDNGIGIPQKEQATIFDKFTRGSNASLQKPFGSGLGLYLAKRAVELLKGRIWLKSEEKKGSEFFVELPLKVKKKIGKKPFAP